MEAQNLIKETMDEIQKNINLLQEYVDYLLKENLRDSSAIAALVVDNLLKLTCLYFSDYIKFHKENKKLN